MALSWEEMCQKVVIDGRPGDVESAALGWEQLIKNLNNVKQSLEANIKDLGATWKGPAYEEFKGHVELIAKDTGQLVADTEKGGGIVQSLKAAADSLSAAQRDFPIPATCVNDVLEARNAKLTIGVGFFEAKVSPDFLGWLDPVSAVADWINDQSKDAAEVYQRVSGEYQTIAPNTPGNALPGDTADPTRQQPNLGGGGGGGGGVGGVPNIGGGGPGGGLGAKPSISGASLVPETGNLPVGSGIHPAFSGEPGTGGYPGVGGVPGTGGLDEEYSSGLAGAGGGVPGLGSGGGGLGSAGLGAGGGGGGGGLGSAGAGGGVLAGGGALGRAVSPGMGPMMGGGGAAGAGRGGGRGAGGRLGAGGKPGGGMMPGMGGVAAGGGGAGRGGAGRGAAGAGAAGRGAGARGAGGMAGMGGGAGYGEDDTSRNTWLEEDEDVWGADGGGTSGILR
ncbi:uncharacterized protein YukE [Micromonospora profundi]|uniref:WXG100 family type VII secretion target n=1 Tax=Micromonospora profundi TaxID=1420889 RepID=UPI00143890F3|nr:hypothetical protein [Micromonospora profundi]NJC14985.1 uncharacterized protein YukE [Micromonospora profundi]